MLLETSLGTARVQLLNGSHDSLHETSPANGLNSNHSPCAHNLQVSLPAPASEDGAMVSNSDDNSEVFLLHSVLLFNKIIFGNFCPTTL